MHTGPMRYWEESVCAISGPLGSLLILLFARQLPLVAVCVVIQSLYNLLPIYPLDGGRALKCLLLGWLNDPLGVRVYQVIEIITLIVLYVVSFLATFILNLGYIPVAAVGIFAIKSKSVKTTCKPRLQRVQ